jgi:hypothetical protein
MRWPGTIAAAVLFVTAPVQASLISFSLGHHPPYDELAIKKGSHPVFGNADGWKVDFASLQSLSAPSVAKIIAINSKGKEIATNDLVISLDKKTEGFSKLVFDSYLSTGKGGVGGGGAVYLTIKGVDKSGKAFEVDKIKDPGGYKIGKGANFLTIVAKDGALLTSVEIVGPRGWTETRQIGMDGFKKLPHGKDGPHHAPEPSTMIIALLGVAGFGAAGLRRARRA